MGRLFLACRLVLADLRRRPTQALVFVLAVGAAATTLAVGLSLTDATATAYEQTRAATNGPDVVVMTPTVGPAERDALARVADLPGIAAHTGPYPLLHTTVTAHGRRGRTVVEGRGTKPAAIDRPLVTSGHWLRPGGVVVERGFATALGVRVGDRITIAGRRFPVVGIAVTAGTSVYPWEEIIGSGGGPSDGSGLVWLTEPDTRALPTARLAPAYVMNVRLTDPADTSGFVARLSASTETIPDPSLRVDCHPWQDTAAQDNVILGNSEPVLVIGGWLLAITAVAGLASLAALRAAEQVRRAGLLKAVGATPGLVAATLFTEYLILALVAAGAGLVVAELIVPPLANPSASLLTATAPVTSGTATSVCALALLVALLTTLGPAVGAARTATVPALAGAISPVRHPAGLTGLAGWLPVPVMLGLRLAARRVRRVVLTACGIAAVAVAVAAVLAMYAQPPSYPYPGLPTPHIPDTETRQTLLGLTAALLVLAAVNTLVITWSTALDARRSLAVARAFGATPGQATAALVVAQLPAALVGAAIGLPAGLGLYWLFSGPRMAAWPPGWWLLCGGAGIVLGVAALAAVPARIHTRQPPARTLGSDPG